MTMMKSYGTAAHDMPTAGQTFEMKAIKQAVEQSRMWVLVYAVMTVVGLAAAYNMTGWSSLITALLVALVTLYVGYRVAQTLIAVVRH